MPAIRDTIGNIEILIQTVDIEVTEEEIIKENKFGTITTSAKPEGIKNVYARAKGVIYEIAKDIGNEMNNMGKEGKLPNTLEMQFNMGFSANANAWFLSTGSEYTLSIKMTWDFADKNE